MFINCMFYFPHLYVTHFEKVIKFLWVSVSHKTKDHRISKILSLFKHKSNTVISLFVMYYSFIKHVLAAVENDKHKLQGHPESFRSTVKVT